MHRRTCIVIARVSGFFPVCAAESQIDRKRVNNTSKRADRNKILPHGVPNDMFERPNVPRI
ncbi:hypothetical protein FB45DRAFT_901700 [Roridomyces roridus]|uniref:Secreted protein n=1 Tax=Roridomyces roridus TaxID=1738132 RepID=A0AAD7C8Q2_9AGAR|nr:hypothetical protein FB45DRAFT_901700 [Roridomyces roridus]